MRDQTVSMLELAAGLALFLGACVYALNMQTILDTGISAAGRMTQEQNAGVTTMNTVSEDLKMLYKGSEVLFTLLEVQTGKYNISVDGILFGSGSDLEQLDLSVIDINAKYDVQYFRGLSGEVESIQFVKVR